MRIEEDGVEQKLNRLFKDEEPFDVGLLVDMSPGAIKIQDGIRDRSVDFVAQMPERNRVLLISFNKEIFIECDWTSDLRKVMDRIEESGLTRTRAEARFMTPSP